MHIEVLGAHNCESRDSRLAGLVIDDILALDAGSLAASLSLKAQQKLRAVLLTHRHYDHIRDIPALAMNAFLGETTLDIYSTQSVYDAITVYLLNGELYPDFLTRPEDNPTIRFITMEPDQSEQIDNYSILAVPVNHSVPAVGFQVTSPDGRAVFYTGDTGPGLAECWQHISPQLLIIEVTAPDRYEEFCRQAGHLTPGLLKKEMDCFRELKGYLPQIITVHMNPRYEEEIGAETAAAASSLNSPITMAYEGMTVRL